MCLGHILALHIYLQKQPSEVFYKKGILKIFAKFTGKHLRQSLFFNKVGDLSLVTLLKKRLWHSCFPVNLSKFLRKPFLQNTSGQLLLYLLNQNFSLVAKSVQSNNSHTIQTIRGYEGGKPPFPLALIALIKSHIGHIIHSKSYYESLYFRYYYMLCLNVSTNPF